MDYCYFIGANSKWWWRVLDSDGSIIFDSGTGYDNERECLAAINRVKGSDNGGVLRQLPAEPLLTESPKPETAKTNASKSEAGKNGATKNEKPPEIQTSENGSDVSNIIVDVILGESPVACVFTTKDKQLRWRYKANAGVLPFRLLGAVSEFDSIMARIAVSVPKSYRKETYHHLGKALFAAFHAPEGSKPTIPFRAVQIFIRIKAKERARLAYVLASLAATMVLGLLVIPIYFMTTNSGAALIALGGWFGSVGASISVLQRNASIEIDPWMSDRYLELQGIARIVLGFIFGSVFVMASKANLVLGLVQNNPYLLLVSCIVAGFSERVIPELLSKFESSQSISTKIKSSSQDQ